MLHPPGGFQGQATNIMGGFGRSQNGEIQADK
jgi:hypothetical protein